MLNHPTASTTLPVRKPGRENQQLVGAVMNRHRKSVLPPWPDWTTRRLVKGHLRQELEKGFEFRLKKLSLELDTALQQVREESNNALVTGKTHLRKQRMEFFAASYNEIMEKFNDLSDRFLGGLDARFERLDKYKSPAIREKEEQRINRAVDTFVATLDQLIEEYRAIITEHVGHEDPL